MHALTITKNCINRVAILSLCILSTVALDYQEYDREEARTFGIWSQRYTNSAMLVPDVMASKRQFERTFKALSLNEKPLAQMGEVYLDNSPHKQTAIPQTGKNIAYVGGQHLNYIQRDDTVLPYYEVFTVPQKKDPQIDKGSYKRNEPEYVELFSLQSQRMVDNVKKDRRKLKGDDTVIVLDPGHGIAHVFTLTYKGSNSTRDVNNFTPQNAYYNRRIRMPLEKATLKSGHTYKEIAIYGPKPLLVTKESNGKKVKEPIPEGFVFLVLNHQTGDIESSYYFPNFHHYKQEEEKKRLGKGKKMEYFLEKYKISPNIAQCVWGHEEITDETARHRAQWQSEHLGYRSLSSDFESLREGFDTLSNDKWSKSARDAFIRTAAIYRIERAAEYDKSVENMLQIAELFNDHESEYPDFPEFKESIYGTLYNPKLAQVWLTRAFEEVKRKDYEAEDIFHFINFESQIPLPDHMMVDLIEAFEKKLEASPNDEQIVRLLEYFDEKKAKDKYQKWSQLLSQFVRFSKVPDSIVINKKNTSDTSQHLSNTDLVNVIFDQEVTEENVDEIIKGFKKRAIQEQSTYKRNLNFLEFTGISKSALLKLFQFFDKGFTHKGKQLYVDVRKTAIKLHHYNKESINRYLKTKCPRTRLTILK